MNNLECHTEIVDPTGRTVYRIRSHRELTKAERDTLYSKKSLQEDGGFEKLPGYVGTYKVVNIIAADGWEKAD